MQNAIGTQPTSHDKIERAAGRRASRQAVGRWPRWRARAVAVATLPVGLGSQFRLRGVLGFRSQEGLRGGKPRKETQPSKPEIPTSNSSMLVPRTTHGQSNTSKRRRNYFSAKDKRSQRKVADSTTELAKTQLRWPTQHSCLATMLATRRLDDHAYGSLSPSLQLYTTGTRI